MNKWRQTDEHLSFMNKSATPELLRHKKANTVYTFKLHLTYILPTVLLLSVVKSHTCMNKEIRLRGHLEAEGVITLSRKKVLAV